MLSTTLDILLLCMFGDVYKVVTPEESRIYAVKKPFLVWIQPLSPFSPCT